jgi:hypothetical protein
MLTEPNVIIGRRDHLHTLEIGAPARRGVEIPQAFVDLIWRSMKNYLPGYDMISRQNGADAKNDGNDCENDS